MPILETYKGLKISDNNGVIEVIDQDTRFIVALDDSKITGGKIINNAANNVESARKYIDWLKQTRS